jgi:glycine dehydrogenase subunit 1
MYLACLGASGVRDLSLLNHDKAEYLKKGLRSAGCRIPFASPTFNEFVAAMPPGFDKAYNRLLDRKIVAGLSLAADYPELENHFLFCATETKSKEDMDLLVKELRSCLTF